MVAAQQHLSLDIPIILKHNTNGSYEQTIDIASHHIYDFMAISILMDCKGITPTSLTGSVISNKSRHAITHFGEEIVENRYVSEIIYLKPDEKGVIRFEYTFDQGLDPKLIMGKIHIFSPAETKKPKSKTKQQGVKKRSDCKCPTPAAIQRADWGASFHLDQNIFIPPPAYTDVSHLIVHHSAGTNISNNWKNVVASIFDFHVNTNGWQDIGYNWLIDPNGVLYEGRGGGENVRGAHMCGYNNNTLGVCVMGNFVSLIPSDTAIISLKKLLAWKCCQDDIGATSTGSIVSFPGVMHHISGHRDGCAPGYTTCPGQALYNLLPGLRNDTETYIASECLSSQVDVLPHHFTYSFTPNPVSDAISLKQNSVFSTIHFSIIDPYGRLVEKFTTLPNETEKTVLLDKLAPGLYFIKSSSQFSDLPLRLLKI